MDGTIPPWLTTLGTNGVLGVVVLGLIWYVLTLRKDFAAAVLKFELQIAAERKLNADLNQQLLAEAKVGFDVAASTKTSLDAFLVAIRTKRT